MAPESSKRQKETFDDELGDDFLSSWKPSKSLAALDFEDDELTPKNRKTSFSLAKIRDASFDFDFDGGLNALSNFNVDMSDLDLPTSRDKISKTKGGNQEKQVHSSTKKGDSKFSFQFDGFDELDLDDTLKTNKEPEKSGYSKKGEKDFSPPPTSSKYCKKGFLDSFSDDASESTSMPKAGRSINKDNHKIWKQEPAPDKGKPSGGLTFSDDELSVHELGVSLQDKQEQVSMTSADYCFPQKRKDCNVKDSSAPSMEASKVSDPAHVDSENESVDRNKGERATPVEQVASPIQLHSESSSGNLSDQMGAKVSSSESEPQKLSVEKTSLRKLPEQELGCKEELRIVDDVEQLKEASKTAWTENVLLGTLEELPKDNRNELEKALVLDSDCRQRTSSDGRPLTRDENVSTTCLHQEIAVDKSIMQVEMSDQKSKEGQEAESGVSGRVCSSLAAKRMKVPQPVEKSPQAPPERLSKRKFSEEQIIPDSPSNKDGSKKLEFNEVSKNIDIEEQQMSDSVSSQKRCKELQSGPPKNHRSSSLSLLPKCASKLVADEFPQGTASLKKSTIPSLQAPRSSIGTQGNQSKFQDQANPLAKLKTPLASLQDNAAEKKHTILGGLRNPLLPPTVQQQKSYNTIPYGNREPTARKQLAEGLMRRTSSLSVLSKKKATGAMRGNCEKAFRFDVASKDTVLRPISHSKTGLDKLSSPEVAEKKLLRPLDKPDTEMADIQSVETLKDISNQENLPMQSNSPLLAVSIENDDGLNDKSENYANRLDQLLKELKDKYEEAMDLRVRALVLSNTFLMLNNPVDDEKIRKITDYVHEKLCLSNQGQAVIQLCQ